MISFRLPLIWFWIEQNQNLARLSKTEKGSRGAIQDPIDGEKC